MAGSLLAAPPPNDSRRDHHKDPLVAHPRHHREASPIGLCRAARSSMFESSRDLLAAHCSRESEPFAARRHLMRGRSETGQLVDRFRLATELAHVSEETLSGVAKNAKVVRLRAGETLWSEGDRPAQVAFVLLGELAVERLRHDGQRKVFRRYPVNKVIGLSTVAGAAHSADIRAHVESEVALLPGKLLLADAAFVAAAFESLARVIKALSDEYQALLYADINERVRRYVHQAALDARREITMTQQELADEIGASRANVARALGKLARRGIVRLGQRGRIEIVDSAELGVV